MASQLSPMPVFKAWDNNGLPLFLGQLFTYAAGTTTPQATYVDSTQTTQNTNPVILNARGEANVWLDPTLSYKFVLQDALGNQIWAVDNIQGTLGVSGNIIPSADNQFSLGNASFRFANGYFATQLYVGSANTPILNGGIVGYIPRTAAEIAAGVTPSNYAYDPAGLQMLKRYGQNGTSGPDTAALTSALAVANGSGVVYVPADYAGTNPSSLAAGVTVIDYRVAGTFPTGNDLLGGGRWINIGGNPEGSVAGFHTQQWVTSPSETTSAILGTSKVTGNLSAAGGAMASGTFELDTYGALTGVSGNIVQALTGQIAIRSTGQTLPLVTGVEGGGGIDRSSATTNINTWVSVQGDAVVNASTSGATITNAYGGRFIQSTASGITNNNFAISSEGDCMFRVGDSLRVENGSGLATIALTFTSNSRLDIPTGVKLGLASSLGIFGATPPTQPTGYGTPTGGSHQGSFAAGSITLPNLAAAVAQLIIDLKAYGLLGS